MRVLCVILIASVCLLQCSEAKPMKKKHHDHDHEGGGGTADISPEEMMSHMSDDCKAFMFKPENMQKIQSMASSSPEALIKMMIDNGCKTLIDFISEKAMG